MHNAIKRRQTTDKTFQDWANENKMLGVLAK